MPTYEEGWEDCRAIQDLLNRVGSNIIALKENIGEFVALKDEIEADAQREEAVKTMLNHVYSDYKFKDVKDDVDNYAALKAILDEDY